MIESDMTSRDVTYGELDELSGRFAAGLAELGVGEGNRVATLMGKSAELVVAALGIWRLEAVQVPLFTAFAPPAIALRVTGTKAIITVAGQRDKLDPGEDIPADPEWTIITTGEATGRDVSLSPDPPTRF